MGRNYNYRLTVEEKGLTGSLAVEGKVNRTLGLAGCGRLEFYSLGDLEDISTNRDKKVKEK